MRGRERRSGGAIDDPTSFDRLAAALRGVSTEGALLPDACISELMSLFSAERFCALRPLPAPGGCSLELAITRGFPPGINAAQQLMYAFDNCGALGPPAFDFSHPTALSARPNQVVRALPELSPQSRGRARELLRRLGAAADDVMRVVLCDGAEFLAWVGVFRRTGFTDDERQAFEQVMPLLSEHLALAQRLRHSVLFQAGLDAALEALAQPAFLLRSDGRLIASNRAARELGFSPAALRERLARALSDKAGGWTVSPVGGGAEPEGYLVTACAGERRSGPVAAASRRWKLTRAETRVLARLGDGCSNKEIARTLCCSVRTVEIHVSAILRKSRCRSRAAAVAALGRMGDSV